MNQVMEVVRRNGQIVPWSREKIEIALRKAFIAQELDEERAVAIAEAVEAKIFSRLQSPVNIESIQDAVQSELLIANETNVASAYANYRKLRNDERRRDAIVSSVQQTVIFVRYLDGSVRLIGDNEWRRLIFAAADGLLSDEDIGRLINELRSGICDELTIDELINTVLSNSLLLAKCDPIYAKVATRLGLRFLYGEVFGFREDNFSLATLQIKQRDYFNHYIEKGVEQGYLDERLNNFNLAYLASALNLDRDYLLSWHAFDLLRVELLLRDKEQIFETPQILWMRVAMGIFINEDGKDERKIVELYDAMSRLEFCPASTTIRYAGTPNPQLVPSYVYSLKDNIHDIMVRGIAENAFASKWGAGLGGSWSNIRGEGSAIVGSHGISEGVRPFLELHRHQLAIANQGPRMRKGAGCAYLDIWHWDVEIFIELRKKLRADRMCGREQELRTCMWIPDVFMARLADEDATWTLFQPTDTQDLQRLFGNEFKRKYEFYESLADENKINAKRISVKYLWQKILALAFETGFPSLAFRDSFNKKHLLNGKNFIPASSLFGEMAMAVDDDETAGGAFGTISIKSLTTNDGAIDVKRFSHVVHLAVEALDAALSATSYPSDGSRRHCSYYRGICLGIAGLHDWLRNQHLPFDCEQSELKISALFESLRYEALRASNNLAERLGPCAAFSDVSNDIKLSPDVTCLDFDWAGLETAVLRSGLRNAYLLACAPNGRVSKLLGVSAGSLPVARNGGSVALPNGGHVWLLDWHLAEELKARGLWLGDIGERLNHLEGDVSAFPELPKDLHKIFATAFDYSPKKLLNIAAKIQVYVDQSQYLPLRLRVPTFSQISILLREAWELGIKCIGPLLTAQSLASERARADFNAMTVKH